MTQFTQRIDGVERYCTAKSSVDGVKVAVQTLREYLADNLMAIASGERVAAPSTSVAAAADTCRTAAITYARLGRLTVGGPGPDTMEPYLNTTQTIAERCTEFAGVFFRVQVGERLGVVDTVQLLRSLRSAQLVRTAKEDAQLAFLLGHQRAC